MHSPSADQSAFVLVVDDEPTIGEVLCRYLERAGFQAGVAGDGPQAIAMSTQRKPDLVILDIMLPGIDGLEVMRRLHESDDSTHRGPAVILLTAKGEESDRIVGLRRGADDYVVKPFSPGALLARVQAVLRRSSAAPEDRDAVPLAFDGLRIDPAARSVSLHGREVGLTQREFDLLVFLARHPGRVFSRDQLIDLVWQLPFCNDSSTVTVHVRRLRAKIEPDPGQPRFIQTVWGVGYRLAP
jgi:DNA-binding response OmpR family regulator